MKMSPKLYSHLPSFLLVVICSQILVKQVQSVGFFQVRLSNFTNLLGQNSQGSCCSGDSPSSISKCNNPCRTFFRVCLKQYLKTVTFDGKCTFGERVTSVVGENNVKFPVADESADDMQFKFEFPWPGTFTLILEAYHDSNFNTKYEDADLILRVVERGPVRVGETWVRKSLPTGAALQSMSFDYRVMCAENYYGDECKDFCINRDDNHGHYNCDASGRKICLNGYEGPYCDKAICLKGCSTEHGGCSEPGECECKIGWKGRFCNECSSHPGCVNGVCVDKPWQCKCMEGWGGELCNIDLNYCTTHNNPCQHGTCLNKGKGYTCTCEPNWTGMNCELRVNNCEQHPCHNGGTCLEQETGFTCKCSSGYYGDTCLLDTPPSCRSSPCRKGATCEDVQDNYVCHCVKGFTGRNCDTEINECKSKPCLNGASCIDQLGGYTCLCPVGFMGLNCETKIRNCDQKPCLNGGTCVDKLNNYQCICPLGLGGRRCQTDIQNCLVNPCMNGGTCHDLTNDFRCTCPEGFSGKDCSIDIDECAANPCRSGGTCIDLINGYRCQCPTGFLGTTCQIQSKTCDGRTCENGGTCDAEGACICPVGYFGYSCEHSRHGRGETFGRSIPNQPGQPRDQMTNGISLKDLLLIVCCALGIPLVIVSSVIVYLVCRSRPNQKKMAELRRMELDQAKYENSFNMAKTMNNHSIIKMSDVRLKVVNETQEKKSIDKISNFDRYVQIKNKNVDEEQQQVNDIVNSSKFSKIPRDINDFNSLSTDDYKTCDKNVLSCSTTVANCDSATNGCDITPPTEVDIDFCRRGVASSHSPSIASASYSSHEQPSPVSQIFSISVRTPQEVAEQERSHTQKTDDDLLFATEV